MSRSKGQVLYWQNSRDFLVWMYFPCSSRAIYGHYPKSIRSNGKSPVNLRILDHALYNYSYYYKNTCMEKGKQ